MAKINSKKDLEALAKDLSAERSKIKQVIAICGGTGCHAYGCEDVIGAFKEEIVKQGLQNEVKLLVTGCHGFCEKGTLVIIRPAGTLYVQVKTEHVSQILERTIRKGEIIEELLYFDPNLKKKIEKEHDVPFYKKQNRLIFGQNGTLDPTSIDDYIGIGGYQALAKVLSEMDPVGVINEVKKSGLRGRGGGGFPTGRKWESCRKAHGDPKYVICNADEGDPGAYMDRSVLEGNPHSVIEGMIIGAYAIGSNQGYVYVRNEYPLAVQNVNTALYKCREYGLIGKDILGSGFDFDITVCRGGGAFVCGESTALMASLEGKVGEPRSKYIHTVESGLWGKPSNLNNVETWANVPLIINKGADWYAKIGTDNSKGTKIFSLVGKINNTGLVEVPMGIKLREIIYDIGGGIPNGRKFKAVQTGGPSGGCLPESQLDLPVDFDELTKAGSMMGSGGMIVMDDRTCMVDVAKYFLHFLEEESCGKCVPCREGIPRMKEILDDICEGRGDMARLELLEELAETVREASLCGLGQTAPNPVLSTIHHFKHEYEEHIKNKKCPAGVCKSLITYSIMEKACTGCTACARACPTKAIIATDKPAEATIKGKKNDKLKVHEIVLEKCIKCGTCVDVCKYGAVEVK